MKSAYGMSFIFILFSLIGRAESCDEWFKESKITVSESCLLNCLSYPVDLGTYMGHDKCSIEERSLIVQHGKEMLTAYQLSVKAEDHCLKLYSCSKTNDESDACRHFIWSALLHIDAY